VVGTVARATDIAEPSTFSTVLLVLRVLITVTNDAAGLGWSAVLLWIFHERNTITGGPIVQFVDCGIEVLSIALLVLVCVLEHGNERGVDHASPTIADDGGEAVETFAGTDRSTEGIGNAGEVGTLGA
jgi:hypothetical protein